MKPRHFSSFFSKGSAIIAVLVIASIINSCKRDSKSASPLPGDITLAKAWYESSYPSASQGGPLVTQSIDGHVDLSKFIKPDWQRGTSYLSNNQSVIEIPIDPVRKFVSTVKIGNRALNKDYSRSSYLLINDGITYKAYILTIIADSAYVKNDLSKLSHNTFRKQDSDFAGLALYYTPQGNYLGGYAYKNGQVVIPTTTTQQAGTQKTQSAGNGNQRPDNVVVACTDWYQQGVIWNADGSVYEITTPWEYMGTTCTSYEDGTAPPSSTGAPGGVSGGSSSTPPPPCPAGSATSVPTASPCAPPPVAVESVGNGKLKVDYMPVPGTSPCSVHTAPVPCYTVKTDVLKNHFPCAVKLIINRLLTNSAMSKFVAPFSTTRRPDLSYTDSAMTWNTSAPLTGANSYQLGATGYAGRSAFVKLNTQALQQSSQLLITAAAIHETLHAYINYQIETNLNYAPPANYNGTKSWLVSLDYWALQNGVPSNYRDHSAMLNDYFSQAVAALKEWDNSAHSDQVYAEAMLYGLNTNDFLALPASSPTSLQTQYNSLLSQYHLTQAMVDSFNLANVVVSGTTATGSAAKLPTTGCTP